MTEFDAVIALAEPIIFTIVERHRTAGSPLTRRLIHGRSSVLNYPLTDDPVDFGKSNAIACAFSMIYEAYHHLHQISAQPRAGARSHPPTTPAR